MTASLNPGGNPPPRVNTALLDALTAQGLLSQPDNEAAALYAKRKQVHAEEALLQMGVMDEATLLKFQANYYKTPFVSTKKLSTAPINESLLKLVTHKLAKKLYIFPVRWDSKSQELYVLTVQPDDLDLLKNVQFATRVPKVKALVARPAAIEAAIKVHFEQERQAFGNIRNAGSTGGLSVERNITMTQESLMPPTSRDSDLSLPPATPEAPVLQRPRRKTKTVQQRVAPPAPPPQAGPPPVPTAGDSGIQGLPSNLPESGDAPVAAAPAAAPASALAVDMSQDPALLALQQSEAEAVAAKKQPAGIAVHDYLETLNIFVALLENERGDLRGHSVMVARICRRLCERLDLMDSGADEIIVAAYLHDVGKTSAYHLTALNVAQYEAHRQQARKSYLTPGRIFESVRLPGDVGRILSQMYERFDGQGFPDRLEGKEICLGARILAIVETYADLTGHAGNPFRKKLSSQEAWDVLVQYKGKVFDANLVDVFKLVVLGDDLRAKLLADSRRALIVDPDAEETTVLELRLAEHGYEVTIARNARDAENELTNDFEVVISEVDLKPVDGFTLLQNTRKTGNEVPFIFLSKHAESDTVQRGFELGADDFITKPAAPDVVALKVNRVLDGARRKKKSGGVSGSLTEMALPDVVQVLFHGRKSGRLTITSDGSKGEILFCDGMIFDANFGDKKRDEAFYEMLSLRDGDFELDPNFRPTEQVIQMPPESLLLEGMRRLDEEGR